MCGSCVVSCFGGERPGDHGPSARRVGPALRCDVTYMFPDRSFFVTAKVQPVSVETAIEMSIGFRRDSATATLRVSAPVGEDLSEAIGSVLEGLNLRTYSWYSVDGPVRCMTYADLRESDGSRLSPHRAAQALRTLGQVFRRPSDTEQQRRAA